MTESHFTMRGRNRCDLNSAWATGVAYARFLNLHQRHGDLLKIANLGDFCGTRWQTNVVMIPTPGGKSYLMPLGKVTALYRKHTGRQAVKVSSPTPDLDIVASRTDNRFFLHVANTHRSRAQSCRLAIEGFVVESGKAFEIAADPQTEITSFDGDPMKMREKAITSNDPYQFPAASVTALELTVRRA
jgi:alpha-L-arabinofuranosidase